MNIIKVEVTDEFINDVGEAMKSLQYQKSQELKELYDEVTEYLIDRIVPQIQFKYQFPFVGLESEERRISRCKKIANELIYKDSDQLLASNVSARRGIRISFYYRPKAEKIRKKYTQLIDEVREVYSASRKANVIYIDVSTYNVIQEAIHDRFQSF